MIPTNSQLDSPITITVEAEESSSKPIRLRKTSNEQMTREEKTGHTVIRRLGAGQKTFERLD